MANEVKALSPKQFSVQKTPDAETVNRVVTQINEILESRNPDLSGVQKTVTLDAPHEYLRADEITRTAIHRRFQDVGWTIRYEAERSPDGKKSIVLVAPAYRGG